MEFKDLIKRSILKKIKFTPVDLRNDSVGGGIYRMYDKSGEVIYVGKSLDLHRRLHQHIGKNTNTKYFIDEVDFFEWHPDPSPIFQGMLEGIFIAYHKPKYNDEVKYEMGVKTDAEEF
jgi:excinuclease UvrABC nuclease subunit